MDDWRLIAQREGSAGYLRVATRHYELPDGTTADWDVLDEGDAAAVLALTRAGDVVLVRQFRAGPGCVLDEMPGGFVDAGETPLDAAARELLEETGYRGTIEIVGSCWLMAGSTRRQWVAVARDCEQVREPEPGPGELCETVLVPLADFRAHLRSGQLTDVDLGYLALDHLGLLADAEPRAVEPDAPAAPEPYPGAALDAQLRFVLDADRLKSVERRSRLADASRRENSAEHSWHLALMAMALTEHADEPVDRLRVVEIVLVHDIVEIDAGDAFLYDEAGRDTKAAREAAAAGRIFGALPPGQGERFAALWEEYEARATPEARFAHSLDRLQPLMLNHAAGGETWREHGITADRVRAANAHIADGSAALWEVAAALIEDSVARGFLAEPSA